MRNSKEKHSPSDWEKLYEKMIVLRMAMGEEEEFERQRWRQRRYCKHRENVQSPHRKTRRMFREQGGFSVVEMQDFVGRKVKQKARMS